MSYPFFSASRGGGNAAVPYGRVRVITPPPIGALTLSETYRHLRQQPSAADDVVVNAMIRTATSHVESITQHALIQRTLRYTVPEFPASGVLPLAWAPLLSLSAVKYLDQQDNEQTLDPSVYRVRIDSDRLPGAIVLKAGQSWPAISGADDAVSVEYVVGYPSTLVNEEGEPAEGGQPDSGRLMAPEELKAAIKLIVGDLSEHREAQNEAQLYVNAAVDVLVAMFSVPRI